MLSQLLTSPSVPNITITSVVLWSGTCTCRIEWAWDTKFTVSQVTSGFHEWHISLSSLQKLPQCYRGNPRTPILLELPQEVLACSTTEQGFPPELEKNTLATRCLDHGWQIDKLICFFTNIIIFQASWLSICKSQEI